MLDARVSQVLSHAADKGFDGPKRATVGFCAGVRHARFMTQRLGERGLVAAVVTGGDSLADREAVYRRFSDPNDPLEWLFVADVLNEGVDIPCINSLLFLRPTESATIFIQQLGRGLRLSPGCEVLTVLDFVGHERAAWIAMQALHDPDSPAGPSGVRELGLAPPRNCEVVLDDQTLQILEKVRKHATSRRAECLMAYAAIRETSDRPMPLDLWARDGVPEIGVFRSVFGTWVNLRIEAEDARDWERKLDSDSALSRFLAALEKDWQQPRVYAYALLWGMCSYPYDPPAVGYGKFFERFPRWSVEFKGLTQTKALATLAKKLPEWTSDQGISSEVLDALPAAELVAEVEGRIRLVLEKDYKTRHGGVLRNSADLVLHRRYDRPEIVNHFGVQYDPAIHNGGVIQLGRDVVIITKLDTSGAKSQFQYSNALIDPRHFRWQSQNQQRQDNGPGRLILDHEKDGREIHLFVQSRSHEKASYFGPVSVASVSGNAPMTVGFQLQHDLPEALYAELTQGNGAASDS